MRAIATSANAIRTAVYVGNNTGGEMLAAGYGTSYVGPIAPIWTPAKANCDTILAYCSTHNAYALANGLKYELYECGPQIGFNDATTFQNFIHDAGNYDLMLYLLQGLEAINPAMVGSLFELVQPVQTSNGGPYQPVSTYWGFLEGTYQTPGPNTPKYNAVVDFYAGKRTPSDLTGTLSCAAGDPNGTVVGTLSKFVVGSTLSIQSGGSGLAINSLTGAVTVANSASLPAAGTYSVVIRETNSGFPTPGYHDTTISWAVIASAALADNFDDNSRDATKWNVAAWEDGDATGVTVAEQNGELEVTGPVSTAGTHYSGYVSVNAVNVTGRAAQVQIKSTGTTNLFYLSFGSDANNNFWAFVDSGTLYLAKRKTGTTSILATVGAWSPTTHQWLRLRHGGAGDDTIYLDTAPSTAANPPASGDWVNRASAARDAAIALTSAHYAIGGGTYGSTPTPTTFKFDNFSAG
jgi:hypothetical protein